jgi:hypothetical protein
MGSSSARGTLWFPGNEPPRTTNALNLTYTRNIELLNSNNITSAASFFMKGGLSRVVLFRLAALARRQTVTKIATFALEMVYGSIAPDRSTMGFSSLELDAGSDPTKNARVSLSSNGMFKVHATCCCDTKEYRENNTLERN